jgi:hypothetical protein
VQSARDLARLIAGDISVSLANGDHERAVEVTGLLFDLSELMSEEPFTITQLVRMAISAMAQRSLEQVVARVDLTPEQFTELDDRLARMQTNFTLAPVMIAERACSFTTLHHIAENQQVLADPNLGGNAGSPLTFWSSGALFPNRLADQAFMLATMREVIDGIDQPGPEGAAAMRRIEARIQDAPKTYVLTRILLPALVNVRQAGLRHREKLITARLGVRVDRFFAAHGKFPESLDELLDDKLPSLPDDLFAGKPHVYRITSDGFVIYSVGPNGVDDGGGEKPDMLEFHANFDVQYPSSTGQ